MCSSPTFLVDSIRVLSITLIILSVNKGYNSADLLGSPEILKNDIAEAAGIAKVKWLPQQRLKESQKISTTSFTNLIDNPEINAVADINRFKQRHSISENSKTNPKVEWSSPYWTNNVQQSIVNVPNNVLVDAVEPIAKTNKYQGGPKKWQIWSTPWKHNQIIDGVLHKKYPEMNRVIPSSVKPINITENRSTNSIESMQTGIFNTSTNHAKNNLSILLRRVKNRMLFTSNRNRKMKANFAKIESFHQFPSLNHSIDSNDEENKILSFLKRNKIEISNIITPIEEIIDGKNESFGPFPSARNRSSVATPPNQPTKSNTAENSSSTSFQQIQSEISSTIWTTEEINSSETATASQSEIFNASSNQSMNDADHESSTVPSQSITSTMFTILTLIFPTNHVENNSSHSLQSTTASSTTNNITGSQIQINPTDSPNNVKNGGGLTTAHFPPPIHESDAPMTSSYSTDDDDVLTVTEMTQSTLSNSTESSLCSDSKCVTSTPYQTTTKKTINDTEIQQQSSYSTADVEQSTPPRIESTTDYQPETTYMTEPRIMNSTGSSTTTVEKGRLTELLQKPTSPEISSMFVISVFCLSLIVLAVLVIVCV